MHDQNRRLEQIIEMITAMASLDFSYEIPIEDEDSEHLRIISIGLNLLSASLEEKAVSRSLLNEQERQYQGLFQHAIDPLFLLSEKGIIQDCNESAENLLGFSQAQLKGRSLSSLIQAPPLTFEQYLEASSSGDEAILAILDKRGRVIPAQLKIRLIPFPANRSFYLAYLHDLTDSEKVKRLAKTNEALFETLFLHAPIGMAQVGLDQKFSQVNGAFESIFGYSQEEIKSYKYLDLIHPDDRVWAQSLEKFLLQTPGGNVVEEIRYRHKNGKTLYILVSGSIVPAVNGKDGYFIGQYQDITDQKKAEQQLEQEMRNLERANSELDQFAYIASHDLKAPLRGIASLSQFIREDLGDSIPESIASHLQMIQERIENMNDLIEGILEYARVGRTTDKKTTTELRQALEEAQALVFAVSSFTLNAPSRLPTVVGPKVVWVQIFQNLLQNAIQYNDKEICEINILVKETPKSHRIGIRDNGPGIPPEHQAKIFQLFQRLNMDSSRKNGGVGLAIVKKQVEQLDGSIWVESRNKSGATFWLEIPKRQQAL